MELPKVRKIIKIGSGESSPNNASKNFSIKKPGFKKGKQTSQQNLKAMLQEKFRETGQAVMLISNETKTRRELQSRLILPTREIFETAQSFYKLPFSTSTTKELISENRSAEQLLRTQSLMDKDSSLFTGRLEQQNKLHFMRESFYSMRKNTHWGGDSLRFRSCRRESSTKGAVDTAKAIKVPQNENSLSEDSPGHSQSPVRQVVDLHDPDGVYLPRPCEFKGLQKVPDIFEYVPKGKDGVLTSLDHNQRVKSTLERFFTRTANNSFGEVKQSLNQWEKREGIASRQRVFEKRNEQEEFVLMAKKHKSYASLSAATSNERGLRESKEPETSIAKPTDVYYKACWSRGFNELILPVSDSTKVFSVGGLPVSLSKDGTGTGYMASMLDPSKSQILSRAFPGVGFDHKKCDFVCKYMEGLGILVFGGRKTTSSSFQKLEVVHETLLLDLQKQTTTPILADPEIDPTPGRFNAATCTLGNLFFVQGGRNKDNRICEDTHLLDVSKRKWIKTVVAHSLPRVEHHSMIPAFKSKSIERHADIFSEPMNQNLKHVTGLSKTKSILQPNDGIYLFGGKSAKNIDSNQVSRLKVFCNPFSAESVSCLGIPPSPRHGCCLEYLQNHYSLVVYGGKSGSDYLADLFLLNLHQLTWIEVKITGHYIPAPRAFANSWSGVHNSQEALFIQGGLNSKNYLPGNVEILVFEAHLFQKQSSQQQQKLPKKQPAEQNRRSVWDRDRRPSKLSSLVGLGGDRSRGS